MTVALFRLFRTRGTILEANLSQTIGSASTSLASGTIFTIPALFMWDMVPPYLQVVVLFLGAVLGLAAMIPLRRLLVVKSHDELPYPEGTACAEVLRATVGGSTASAWIFSGMALGAQSSSPSLAFLTPASVYALLPVLPKAELGWSSRRHCSESASSWATGSRACSLPDRSCRRSSSRRSSR